MGSASILLALAGMLPASHLALEARPRTDAYAVLGSYDRDRVLRFVFCYECLAKVIERPVFNLSARLSHQIQIKVQVVQRDKAKPENFLSLDEMTNVAARKCAARLAGAIFFYGSFVQCELSVL
jgi:hypothetical protein